MDQLKQYLAVARKHHFWILCGVAALAGILAWYLGKGKLMAEFTQAKSKVEQAERTVQGISMPHPNDQWKELKASETERLSTQVLDIWNSLYNQQKEGVYSKWPQSLNQEFMEALRRHQTNPQFQIPLRLREHYQNVVRNEPTRLAQIVDSDPTIDASGAPGTGYRPSAGRIDEGGAAAGVPIIEHRVIWEQLKDIRDHFDWDIAPSTQIIKYAQEELWVYEALCNVIAKVNEGSTGPHNAPIKEIANMAIAYATFQGAGAGTPRNWVAATGAPIGGGEEMSYRGAPGGQAGAIPDPKTRGKRNAGGRDSEFGRGSMPMGDPAAPTDPDEIWKSYRYVTPSGDPILAADIETRSPPEYNLMPFRLTLVVDPRRVDKLLLEMKNSALPFEVREVRINPEAGGSGSTGGRTPSRSYDGNASSGSQTNKARTVNLEVAGVAYLIKQPDPAKVGLPYQDVGGAAPAAPVE